MAPAFFVLKNPAYPAWACAEPDQKNRASAGTNSTDVVLPIELRFILDSHNAYSGNVTTVIRARTLTSRSRFMTAEIDVRRYHGRRGHGGKPRNFPFRSAEPLLAGEIS